MGLGSHLWVLCHRWWVLGVVEGPPGCRLGVVGVVRGHHIVVLVWQVVVCGRHVVICGWWAGLWVVDSFAGGAGRLWVGG